MKLRIVGDSHVAALGNAFLHYSEARDLFANVEKVEFSKLFPYPDALSKFWQEKDGKFTIRRRSRGVTLANDAQTADLSGEPDVVHALVLPYSTNLFLRSPTWNRYRPWQCAEEKYHVLSDQTFAAMVAHHIRYILGFLDALQQSTVRCVVVEAPPIRLDDQRAAKGRLSEDAILFVDRRYREIVDAALADRAIGVVHCPEEAFDGDRRHGFLRDDLRRIAPRDMNHANEEYGLMHLRRIAEYLDRHQAELTGPRS